jgi:hypothetical protein
VNSKAAAVIDRYCIRGSNHAIRVGTKPRRAVPGLGYFRLTKILRRGKLILPWVLDRSAWAGIALHA